MSLRNESLLINDKIALLSSSASLGLFTRMAAPPATERIGSLFVEITARPTACASIVIAPNPSYIEGKHTISQF